MSLNVFDVVVVTELESLVMCYNNTVSQNFIRARLTCQTDFYSIGSRDKKLKPYIVFTREERPGGNSIYSLYDYLIVL
jgi:hypothetical protein